MSETVLLAGWQAQCEGVQERGQGEPHGFLIVSEVTVQQVHVDAGVTVEGGAQVSGFTDHAGAARVVAVVNSRIIIVFHVARFTLMACANWLAASTTYSLPVPCRCWRSFVRRTRCRCSGRSRAAS